MHIESLFDFLLQYSFVLPPLFFFFYFKKARLSPTCITIIFYCFIFFIFNFYSDAIMKIASKKGYYFLYTLLEYISFALIFYYKAKSKNFKRLIILFTVSFIVFQVIYYSVIKFRRLDTVPIGVETILIFIFIIFYLYEEFKNPKSTTLYLNYTFWISTGVMFYLAGAFFFNILANHLDRAMIQEYWYLSYNADIIRNILFAVSIYVYAKHELIARKSSNHVPYLDMI